jgi:hypothetical protein
MHKLYAYEVDQDSFRGNGRLNLLTPTKEINYDPLAEVDQELFMQDMKTYFDNETGSSRVLAVILNNYDAIKCVKVVTYDPSLDAVRLGL